MTKSHKAVKKPKRYDFELMTKSQDSNAVEPVFLCYSQFLSNLAFCCHICSCEDEIDPLIIHYFQPADMDIARSLILQAIKEKQNREETKQNLYF